MAASGEAQWAKEWYKESAAYAVVSSEEKEEIKALIKRAGMKEIEFKLIGIHNETPIFRVKYQYSTKGIPTVLYQDTPGKNAATSIKTVAIGILAAIKAPLDTPTAPEEVTAKVAKLKPTKKVVHNASKADS